MRNGVFLKNIIQFLIIFASLCSLKAAAESVSRFDTGTILPGEKVLISINFTTPAVTSLGAADMLLFNSGGGSRGFVYATFNLYKDNTLIKSHTRSVGNGFASYVTPESPYNGPLIQLRTDIAEILAGTSTATLEIIPHFDGVTTNPFIAYQGMTIEAFKTTSDSFDGGYAAPELLSLRVIPITPSITIKGITNGSEHECSASGGTHIPLTAYIDVTNPNDISLITWKIDDNIIGYGESIEPLIPLGTHEISVALVLSTGETKTEVITTSIIDTIKPQIAANMVDVKTGDPLTQILSNIKVSPSIIVTDACDPDPLVNAVAGIPTISGDEFFIDKSRKNTSVRTDTDVDTFELSVTATDASGNTATENLELGIITR